MRNPAVTRRKLLVFAGIAGATIVSAACAPSAPGGQTSQPPAAARGDGPATSKPAAATGETKAPASGVQLVNVPFAIPKWIPIEASWLVGHSKGYFREMGVELEYQRLTGTNNIIPALVSGSAWLGFPSVGGGLTSIEKGSNLRFVGGGVNPPAFFVLGRKGITKLEDVQSIASSNVGALTYDLTTMVLKEKGLEGKVERVIIGATEDTLPALIAGKVDAALGDVTFTPIARREGLTTLATLWDMFPNYTTSAYVSTSESIAQHRDAITRALAAFALTYKYIYEDPGARDVWIEQATTELQEEQEAAEVEFAWYKENKGFALNLDLTPAQLEFMQQLNIDTQKQERVLPFDQIADMSLRQAAIAMVK